MHIEQYGASKVELNTLLKDSDIICLCASLNENNYHMIGEKEISCMKDNVYISNSARGALVDEKAMLNGLQEGKIAGYATDVMEVEPTRATHPFLKLDNVIVTPHTSAYTLECLHDMGEKCVCDCEDVIKGILPERSVQAKSTLIKD